MIQIKGKYNTAICFTDYVDDGAQEQIKEVCDQKAFADCKIRIMPDVHAGKGCTIGTTMTITDKIVPGMVGVDIGCGMETVRIAEREVDFEYLDKIIRKNIPYGRAIRQIPHKLSEEIDLTELRCAEFINLERSICSIGTLGGGNHFIEVDKDDDGNVYIVVHSGSRHLGTEVADYYQDEARKALWGEAKGELHELVAKLRAEGRFSEIQTEAEKLKAQHEIDIPWGLAYVQGQLFDDYIHDMKIVQKFATLNRKAMMDVIMVGMRFTKVEEFTTIHNYVDMDAMILRKGSVSSKKGEKLLIPINMRDGSLVCIGKGNEDWNCSAPHGAGRLMSRSSARERLTIEEYQNQMQGIYSTCVSTATLDESPMAYKPMDEIMEHIQPTAEIVARIKPLYNFKAPD